MSGITRPYGKPGHSPQTPTGVPPVEKAAQILLQTEELSRALTNPRM